MFLKVLLINTYYHHTEPINTQSIMDPKISVITVIYQYRLNQKPDNQHKPTSVSISHCPTNLDLFSFLIFFKIFIKSEKYQISIQSCISDPNPTADYNFTHRHDCHLYPTISLTLSEWKHTDIDASLIYMYSLWYFQHLFIILNYSIF